MEFRKLLILAVQMQATELLLKVGWPVQVVVRGKVHSFFLPSLRTSDFEALVIQRLAPMERSNLWSFGHCKWEFDAEGVGKVTAEVEKDKATLVLPAGPNLLSNTAASGNATSMGTVPGFDDRLRSFFADRLRSFFGRK